MFASTSVRSSTFEYYDFFTRHRNQDFKTLVRAAAIPTYQGTSVASNLCQISKATKICYCVSGPSVFSTYTKSNSFLTKTTSFESEADSVDVLDGVIVRGHSVLNPPHGTDPNSDLDKTDASDAALLDNCNESDTSDVHARANGAGGGGSGPRETGWHALDPIWQVS